MGLAISSISDVQVLRIDGELDTFAVQEMRARLEAALDADFALHAVDASELISVDSSGIGLLVALYKKASARQIPFALTGLHGQPDEMIRFLKIDRRVPVHTSVDAARAALVG